MKRQEEAFHTRPSIKIIIPDRLKGLLVDDWENITKNNQLVPLPHPKPVNKVLSDYMDYEKPKRPEGSPNIDILEETVAGLKEYFDKCLSRILLYRQRAQYSEIREKWISGGPEWQGKTACDTYGSEHLMRLMASMPELIAQTNMDQQSVNRLREELSKFCQWLEKDAGEYFVKEYEVPNAEYTEKAKN
ncbi:histone acetylase complex subunit [Pseudomassariella vexata]|uniref:Chromatin modification-related protein EAF3 n=1 Tax=Pseudomassariella vexata TaxID=1141098 RepID=A0A1Y2DLU3_9PEZI|nr:histone acetylase complex subunit [Pseudomassariella vexata]ORY60106.1 histone acetylase complex subunit [Pseudomassariella vexata]